MAEHKLRYGVYLGKIQRNRRQISYSSALEAERLLLKRPRLRTIDIHRLLTPYVSVRFVDQVRAVVPLALMLVGFQALALRSSLLDTHSIVLGILAVIIGLMFFMEGVKLGLMPFAENVGFHMPGKTHPTVLLLFSLLLGGAATFAEPSIGALQAAASAVSAERAPWLRQLLGPYVFWLVLAVAVGVGLAVSVGMVRMMLGWQLKKLVLLIVPPTLALTAWAAQQPDLIPIIGLAWDCGAVTTGPVTVPLVLAVGVGVAASAGRSDNPLSGFGIVTLASLFPILAVFGVSIYLTSQGAGAMLPMPPEVTEGWRQQTPMPEIIGALQAILPLLLLLVLVQTLLLRLKIQRRSVFVYGALMAVPAFPINTWESLASRSIQKK